MYRGKMRQKKVCMFFRQNTYQKKSCTHETIYFLVIDREWMYVVILVGSRQSFKNVVSLKIYLSFWCYSYRFDTTRCSSIISMKL